MINIKVHLKTGDPIEGYAELPDIKGGADFGKWLLLMDTPEESIASKPFLVLMDNVNYLQAL